MTGQVTVIERHIGAPKREDATGSPGQREPWR
jgi:hypothetical protein